MAGEYDTSRNSRRWPLTVFYTLLNVSTINAYILYCHNPENKLKRRLIHQECKYAACSRGSEKKIAEYSPVKRPQKWN